MNNSSVINLIFTGDFVPDLSCTSNEKFFCAHLGEMFRNADLHVTNLESPLTLSTRRINKSGPHIKKEPKNIKLLEESRVNIACMANNHVYDFGEEGLLDTINVCNSSEIDTIGIVNRFDEKPAYLIKEISNRKIGFLNYCEHEFSVREEGKMGANGYDNIKVFYELKELKNICDFMIVIYHGGVEYYPLPRPELKKIFRYLIDIGADAVISHHTHTISGFEVYKNKPVIYGLGNFYFPYENEPEEWFTGLVLKMSLGENIDFNLHPVRQSEKFKNVKLLTGKEKEIIEEKISNLNKIITDDRKLQQEWIKYIEKVKSVYLKQILNLKKYENIFIKMGLFRDKILKSKRNDILRNLISCESHRDIISGILK